jgi:ribosomal protein L29
MQPKTMKLTEIRGKDSRELKLDIQNLEKESFALTFRSGEGEGTTCRRRAVRRTLARIKTVLRERDMAEQGQPEAKAKASTKAKAGTKAKASRKAKTQA